MDTMTPSVKLTPHFRLREFLLTRHSTIDEQMRAFCSHEKNLVNMTMVAKFLEKVREIYGYPISINSGFRSEKVNKAVGGSSNSYHKVGRAVDLPIPKDLYTSYLLLRAILAAEDVFGFELTEKIIHKNHIHLAL